MAVSLDNPNRAARGKDDAPMASFHFGSTGAEKTTCAIKMCTEIGGIRFSFDE